jgi:tape measure domain-containing protein
MASKQVQEIKLRLITEGGEGLDKLKSSFRELGKAIGPTEETIEKTRRAIIEFGEAGNKSEQLIKGQIAAFKGLQSQATTGGKVYNDLKKDIKELEGVIYGANAALEEQRKRLTQFGTSSDATAFQIQQTINALVRLRSETRVDSEAFNKFGESIATLTNRLKAVNQETQNFADAQRRIVRPIGASSAAARQQIRDLELVTEALRSQRDELGALEGQARLRRGVADLAERGVRGTGRLSFEEALAESLLGGQALSKLLPAKDIESALNEVRRQIGDFQREIEVNLSKGIQRSFQETARAGRESARAMAAAFSDPELINVFNRFDDRLGEIPQTATGFSQRLRELQQVFANTARSAENYISIALDIARVQREASAATQGLGAALVRDLNTGVAVRNKKNLQEAIGQLQAEMNELDTQTAEGSRLYAENANQVRNLERQLRELGDSYRHVADMATQAATAQTSEATARVTANYLNRGMVRAQEQALAELGQRVRAGVAATPLALPAAGQTTAPGTGLEISGGARVGRATGRIQQAVMRPVFGEDIGGTGLTEAEADRARRAAISERDAVRDAAEARARAEQQIQSYRAEIDKARRADIGSIESTERLRSAINQYRSTLPGASAEFRKLTKELGDLDVRSEKLSRNLGRRRMTGMQMTQAAGAALSGGIFGGPEGFLGGAIGSAFGVGGAFAGAAIGAQVGGLRQQLGGFADYAAQIQKMQIALENAAGSQAQFNQAMAAAESATRNLNVPQDVAIQGMTRLTAAVKGAGGQVSDAEIVFNNVTSAIKATGGSAQDVDGAITAMVQVFSKGKVSAEELSGQLGERLPGAVTKFAKANDMTLPELQKLLEQGRVGLNEMMKFIVYLGNENAGVADKMARSSQDAGARLTVAYNDMRIAVGSALQPIGAQFQEAFIPFIENITPILVNVLPKIGNLAVQLAKNFDDLAVAVAAFGATLAAVNVASFVANAGGIVGALVKVKAAFVGATAAMTGFAAASAAVPWIALAAGAAAAAVAIYNASNAQQDFNNKIYEAPISEVKNEILKLQSELVQAEEKLQQTAMQFGTLSKEAAFAQAKVDGLRSALDQARGDYRIRLLYQEVGVTPDSRYFGPGFAAAPSEEKPSELPRFDSDKAGAGKAKKERESQLPQLMAQLAVRRQIAEIDERINGAQLMENQLLQIRLEGEKQIAQLAGQYQAIQFENIPEKEKQVKRLLVMEDIESARLDIAQKLAMAARQADKDIAATVNDLEKSYENQIFAAGRLEELTGTGMTEALAQQYIEIEKIIEKQRERYEEEIAYRQAIIELGGPGVAEAEAGIDLFRGKIEGLGGREAKLKDLATAAQPEEKGKLQQFIEQAEAELKDLEALAVRVSQNIGNAVGNSIANGITGLIEGTTTAKEVFADFLKDVGQILVQEGAKMIATYIAIGIAKMFAGLASGGGGGGGEDPLKGVGGADWMKYTKPNANGNVYAQNSIQPFAMGGIVTRPTFFKYAKGGTMQNGLMGEAGPEAIMPLKRGADGKLGVSALDLPFQKQGGEMSPEASAAFSELQSASIPFTKTTERLMTERSERETVAAINNPKPLDVRFESQVINGVEYVTAEQHQKGMAQAAERGRALTLAALQNSVKTRKKAGI